MDFLLQGQLSVGIFGNLMSVRSRAWCGTLLLFIFFKKREKKAFAFVHEPGPLC